MPSVQEPLVAEPSPAVAPARVEPRKPFGSVVADWPVALRRLATPLAILLLAAASAWLHREGLFGGPAYYERDTQLFYYPLAQWVGEQLRAGHYPLWLPGIFTGYPIFADGELGLLYAPQVALLALLPGATAIVWLRALHVSLAGLFTYLFLRSAIQVGAPAAVGGALVFAFGSFLTAQMHHENVVRSAVWLPLVLALLDRALRHGHTRRGWAWLSLAALAFAQSALGLHVQPVLMQCLALGGYVLFRLALGWPSDVPSPGGERAGEGESAGRRRWSFPGRLAWGAFAVAGSIAGGLALAAAQWGPLLEWSRTSFRRGGVSYEFASAFGLAPQNLPTLLFPYFFRLPDQATWWMLWQQWEIHLYVGIPTMALTLVALFASRRREVLFFLALGLFAFVVAMTHYSPTLNLHEALWRLPGFSFLRAPGRFTYLVVFAAAGLAALGLQALADRRSTPGRQAVFALGFAPPLAALAGLLLLLPTWREWLAADPPRGLATVQAGYLSARAQYPIEPAVVYSGLLASLDLANPKTAWSLALLGLTAAGFAAWLALGRQRAPLGQALLVGLLAADLLAFAADFHPRAPLARLMPPELPGVPAGERVVLRGDYPDALSALEPNQLLTQHVHTVDGYSSLPSQRHLDLHTQTQERPALLDVWSARYVVEPLRPADAHQAGGVAFRTQHPLAGGYKETGIAAFEAPPQVGLIQAVRIVGTLGYAFDLPQGTPVADVWVVEPGGRAYHRLHVRAGLELAERAYDRPSLKPHLRHAKPPGPPAYTFEEWAPTGELHASHLYLAELPLPHPVEAEQVLVQPVHASAQVQIHGMGLVGADGGLVSLGLADRVGFDVVSEDPRMGVRVVENRNAHPRAYVRDRAYAYYRAKRPDDTPVQIMTGPEFDPGVNYLIETPRPMEDYGALLASVGDRPAEVEDLGPNALRIAVETDRPSYLLVNDHYHRGWQAWVDGQPAPVYIANAVFRAVPIEAGSHVVEMRFQPLSHLLGAAVSLVALAVALGVAVWGFTSRPRTRPQPI